MIFAGMYPKMTSCPVCGEPALDGHITCGRADCNEGEQRRKRADEWIERDTNVIDMVTRMTAFLKSTARGDKATGKAWPGVAVQKLAQDVLRQIGLDW